MLKKYLVFGGECCYPNGGFGDFTTSFDSKQEAISEVENKLGNKDLDDNKDWKWLQWGQVVDRDTGEVWHYMSHRLENREEWEFRWTNHAEKIWNY